MSSTISTDSVQCKACKLWFKESGIHIHKKFCVAKDRFPCMHCNKSLCSKFAKTRHEKICKFEQSQSSMQEEKSVQNNTDVTEDMPVPVCDEKSCDTINVKRQLVPVSESMFHSAFEVLSCISDKHDLYIISHDTIATCMLDHMKLSVYCNDAKKKNISWRELRLNQPVAKNDCRGDRLGELIIRAAQKEPTISILKKKHEKNTATMSHLKHDNDCAHAEENELEKRDDYVYQIKNNPRQQRIHNNWSRIRLLSNENDMINRLLHPDLTNIEGLARKIGLSLVKYAPSKLVMEARMDSHMKKMPRATLSMLTPDLTSFVNTNKHSILLDTPTNTRALINTFLNTMCDQHPTIQPWQMERTLGNIISEQLMPHINNLHTLILNLSTQSPFKEESA